MIKKYISTSILCLLMILIITINQLYAIKPSEKMVPFVGRMDLTANTLKRGESILGVSTIEYNLIPYWYGISERLTLKTSFLELALIQYLTLNFNLIKGKTSISLSYDHYGPAIMSGIWEEDMDYGALKFAGLNLSQQISKKFGIHTSIRYFLYDYKPYNREAFTIGDYSLGFHIFLTNSILYTFQIKCLYPESIYPDSRYDYNISIDIYISEDYFIALYQHDRNADLTLNQISLALCKRWGGAYLQKNESGSTEINLPNNFNENLKEMNTEDAH